MTNKKAIKMLDAFIEYKSKAREVYSELARNWSTNPNGLYRIAKQLEGLNGGELEWLVRLKEQITTKCRHPKKMKGIDPGGKAYCMVCNQDL